MTATQDKWYRENRERVREQQIAYDAQGLAWIIARKVHCEHCFTADNLEFHHLDPATKLHSVGHMTTHSLANRRAEINKCLVLCRDCHCNIHRNAEGRINFRQTT